LSNTTIIQIASETAEGPAEERETHAFAGGETPQRTRLHTFFPWIALALIAVFGVQLGMHAVRTSVTYDEPVFIFAGYHIWRCDDHGVNPENPPLVSLVAALPLRGKNLVGPTPLCPASFTTKFDEYTQSMQFLVDNKIDPVVIPARFAEMFFSLLLAVTLVFAMRRMFGEAEALVALALLVFEPNVLAHGSLATADMAATATFFASVFALYLFLDEPSFGRAAALGLGIGAMLATKASALPAIIFLWLITLAVAWRDARGSTQPKAQFIKGAQRAAAGLLGAMALGYVVLWACYGFHFYALPKVGHQVLPGSALDADTTGGPALIAMFTQWGRAIGILPEAYLFGITDVLRQNIQHPAYIFGKMYGHGLWYYFPVAFSAKTSVTLLVMLAVGVVGLVCYREKSREVIVLALPALCYFAFILSSGLDIGIRHLLPAYPFLIGIAAAGVCQLTRRAPKAWIAAIALLAFAGVDSARTFPNYISFGNELWGGTNNTYKLLSDSNTDWGQNLKQIRRYIDAHHVGECWIAAAGTPDIALATLPCHLLPARYQWMEHPLEDIPETISGTVFLSDEDLPAQYPGAYETVAAAKPTAFIGGTTFVYDGTFNVKPAAMMVHTDNSTFYYKHGRLPGAIAEMRAASEMDPNDPRPHCAVAVYLMAGNDSAAARSEFQTCIQLAGSDPDTATLRGLAQQQLQRLP
jgi:4-amino-4-deoxy-L-arabinose transferase-like glycosyltransferase